jgi:hypothetical protein
VSERNNAEAESYQRAEEWAPYIKRGASGRGPHGSESSSEYLLVLAAGTTLPNGEPVLKLLDRFSVDELAGIKRSMEMLGPDVWYWPVRREGA